MALRLRLALPDIIATRTDVLAPRVLPSCRLLEENAGEPQSALRSGCVRTQQALCRSFRIFLNSPFKSRATWIYEIYDELTRVELRVLSNAPVDENRQRRAPMPANASFRGQRRLRDRAKLPPFSRPPW